MSFCTSCGARLVPTTAQAPPTCPQCGALTFGMQFCINCGIRLTTVTTPQAPTTQPVGAAPQKAKANVPRKYGALRAVATIYRIIGWVILIGGSLLSIAAGALMTVGLTFTEEYLPQIGVAEAGAAAIAIGGIILSVLFGLLALAFADLCSVLMDIEANTRQQGEGS